MALRVWAFGILLLGPAARLGAAVSFNKDHISPEGRQMILAKRPALSVSAQSLGISALWEARGRSYDLVTQLLRPAAASGSATPRPPPDLRQRQLIARVGYDYLVSTGSQYRGPIFPSAPPELTRAHFVQVAVRPIVARRPAPVSYTNLFDVERGYMVLVNNDNTRDVGLSRPPHSDILFESYQRAAVARYGGFSLRQPAPLRLVVRCHIVNSDTEAVLAEAHRRAGYVHSTASGFYPGRGYLTHDVYEERIWRPGSDGFRAIMGTVHGLSVLWLLRDHAAHWGNRYVARVATMCEAPRPHGSGGRGGWSIMMHIAGGRLPVRRSRRQRQQQRERTQSRAADRTELQAVERAHRAVLGARIREQARRLTGEPPQGRATRPPTRQPERQTGEPLSNAALGPEWWAQWGGRQIVVPPLHGFQLPAHAQLPSPDQPMTPIQPSHLPNTSTDHHQSLDPQSPPAPPLSHLSTSTEAEV